jgi:hypothetical protein
MPVINPRTRLISFRLSEQEYARLRTLSTTQGARSLADFVRASVCWAMDNNLQRDPQAMDSLSSGMFISEGRLHTPPLTPGVERSHEPFGTLAGLLLALQWKAESLDQEVRDLVAVLRGADPRAVRGIHGSLPTAG